MKKIILCCTIIMACFTISGQNIDNLKFKNTKDSLTSVLLSEYDFYNSKRFKIKQKLDSIRLEKQIELITQIEGQWEYIKGACPDCIISKDEKKIKRFIKITRKDIIFYQDAISENNIIAKEQLRFSDYMDSFSGLTSIVYSDKRVWNFTIDTTQNYLYTSYIGNEKKDHISTVVSGNYTHYYKRIN